MKPWPPAMRIRSRRPYGFWRLALALGLALGLNVAADRSQAEPPTSPPELPLETLRAAAEQGSVRAQFELAKRLAAGGQGQEALAELEKALRAAPNSEELLDGYARLAMGLGRPVVALPALQALVRLDSANGEAAYLLGISQLQLGDAVAAAEALEKAVQLNPERSLFWTALGLAHNVEKKYPAARKALAEALLLAPGDLEAAAALAEAEQGDGESAAAAARAEAILAKTLHPTALWVRGMAAMERQAWPMARTSFEELVALQPEAARAHYQLSLACARLGDRQASQRHLQAYQRAATAQERKVQSLRGASLPLPEEKHEKF